MENFFNNQRILNSIWKWKIHIIIVIIIGVIASVIISSPSVITPKFKSTARLYPVNLSEYSDESESEQLLEFIRASDIQFKVIDAFELDKVYKLSKEDPLYLSYMMYEYGKNVSYKKTEFETIEIKVLDEDPQRACDMVDSIIVFYNEKIRSLHGLKYKEVAEISNRDLTKKNKEIDSLINVLSEVSKETGVLDYKVQVEKATEGLMDASTRGGSGKPAKELLNSLSEKGNQFRSIQKKLYSYEIAADSLKRDYDWAISHATKKITYCIVAEPPYISDKKAFPVRWLIVFLVTLSTLFVSVITVSLIDYFGDKKSA